MKIQLKNPAKLAPYINNAKKHSSKQISMIGASIKEFGFNAPILLDGDNGIIAGHGRVLAALSIGLGEVPTIDLSHLSEYQKKAYVLADNRLGEVHTEWDNDLLTMELDNLKINDFDVSLTGFDSFDSFEDNDYKEEDTASGNDNSASEDKVNNDRKGALSRRFFKPPFSVLSAREGGWQERKRQWVALGIKSDEGRDNNSLFGAGAVMSGNDYDKKNKLEKELGTTISEIEYIEKNIDDMKMKGVSIFDPVLCEILYYWFSPKGGTILDPFSGGSVRGIVAGKTGFNYVGCDN